MSYGFLFVLVVLVFFCVEVIGLGNSSHGIPSKLLSCCLSCWDAILYSRNLGRNKKKYFFLGC